MVVAAWRAALRQSITKEGPWARIKASQGKLSAALASSVVDHRRYYSPKVTVKSSRKLNLGIPADLDLLRSPDVRDALIRPVPCVEDDRGAINAAEYALRYHQGVCLEKVVSAHVVRRGWSLYSVFFQGSDWNDDNRLYHAYVLHDPGARMKRLLRCGTIDESTFRNVISQPPRVSDSDPEDISRGIADAVVPLDIVNFMAGDPQGITNDACIFLQWLVSSIEDRNIRVWNLLAASQLEIDGGGVLHFMVVLAKVNNDFRSCLAVIKSIKLFVFCPVDELF